MIFILVKPLNTLIKWTNKKKNKKGGRGIQVWEKQATVVQRQAREGEGGNLESDH